MLRALALFALLSLPLVARADTPAATPVDMIRHAKRIVCLGDSITHAGGWVVPLGAWLERRFDVPLRRWLRRRLVRERPS